MNPVENPVGLRGIEFIEFSSARPERLDQLFKAFGFSKVAQLGDQDCFLYVQGDMKIVVNTAPGTHSEAFEKAHGPCVSAMGWRVQDAAAALRTACARGAKQAEQSDYRLTDGALVPAIVGIGESLIYFVDETMQHATMAPLGFSPLKKPELVPSRGFTTIDHLTNNVERGTMETWSNFYKDIFGFTEIRYFDIRGQKTGLVSYALKSPDGSFCIPINEGTESKSQINEYLREYNGPGVQHIAFLTPDILTTLQALEGSTIETLDIDDEYYREVFDRVPNVSEDHKEIQRLNVLVDGDDDGYLLQIFTKNIIGPIFIEIIQRKNHYSFGEGNFGALFRAIERDQERRGTL